MPQGHFYEPYYGQSVPGTTAKALPQNPKRQLELPPNNPAESQPRAYTADASTESQHNFLA